MKTSTISWIIIAIVIIGGGAYWYSTQHVAGPSTAMGTNGSPNQGNMGDAGTGAPPAAGQGPTSDGSGVSDNFALGIDGSTALGSYLIAYNGMTVYTYDKDTAGVSNCTGTCATNWPPYIVPAGSTLNLQAGVTGAIKTITRADGTTQVTYKGMPLYFYIGDKASGDTTGNKVGGGVWHVVTP